MASMTQRDDVNDCRGMGKRENVPHLLFTRRLYSNPLFVPHYVIEFQQLYLCCLFSITYLTCFFTVLSKSNVHADLCQFEEIC